MAELEEIMPESEIRRITDRIDKLESEREFGETAVVQCREVQPRSSEFIGKGNNRCVFRKQGKIIKVARNRDGRTENKGGRVVMENVSQENRDAFIVPEGIDESNTVMLTEEADSVGDGEFVPVGAEDFYNEVDKKLREVYHEDGIHCNDWSFNDIGTKNGEPVLTDLGGCSPVNQQS